MERNELDEMFRKLMKDDHSELSEQESLAKEDIWKRVQAPKSEKRIFPFWKAAAAILLFLLGSSSWIFVNRVSQGNQQIAELKQEVLGARKTIDKVQADFAELKGQNQVMLANQKQAKNAAGKQTPGQNELHEKLIVRRDTVYLQDKVLGQPIIKSVRDTVYIEVPRKEIIKFVKQEIDLEDAEEIGTEAEAPTPQKRVLTTKNKSQRIEFVFGDKKPEERPSENGIRQLFKQKELAVEEKDYRGHLISIPLNKSND